MLSNTVVYVGVVLTVATLSATAHRTATECTTPDNENGSCIRLENCTYVYNMLNKKPLLKEDVQYLKRSQCGSENRNILVCCRNQENPAQSTTVTPLTKLNTCENQSSCIELNNCPSLFNLLRKRPLLDEDRAFLRQHQCGSSNGKILVCCRDEYFITVKQRTAFTADLLPKPGVCGNAMADRIYGGTRAKITEFPWMALILYDKPGPRCAGSLINKKYVLTAAHCSRPKHMDEVWTATRIRLGEWDMTTDPDCETDVRGTKVCVPSYVEVPIENFIMHPKYAPRSGSRSVPFDIALIRLSREISYGVSIQPICLPLSDSLKDNSFDGYAMDVAGWGLTEQNLASNTKLKAMVLGVPLAGCQRLYGRKFKVQLESTQLCAGGEAGVDACTGDSGGSLVAMDEANNSMKYYYAAGVISFGPTPCGLQGWPGVYTKVSSFIDWILENIQP